MRARIRARLFASIALVVFACVLAALVVVGRASTPVALAAALVLALPVAFAVSTLAMRWFDEGVRPLADAARRMHAGDLAVRAHVHHDEDVGELGGVFDQLAESLSRTVGELRNERDLVARILDGMQEGVLLLDGDGRIALMNPALREMLLLRADVVDRPLLEVVRHAELKELFDRAARARGACSGEIEVGGLKPRRLLVRATSFTQLDGAARGPRTKDDAGLLAVFFDVTDVRRLESLRRDFVANVSHELRTPVTAVLSAAETLDLALEKDPDVARRFLGIIERNASRLQQLIEDLLDLSHIESRALRLRPERFAFEPFARGVLAMFRERADAKRVRLEVQSGGAAEIDVDRRALEQVLTNLVDNAVKYCPEGSTVVVRATASGPNVRLEVEDDGPGIPESHLPRIFERFYRVDAGRSREMGGTGLGLAIVKHLVEAMGGTIEVRSVVGKGTTFEALLPPHGGKRERASERDLARDDRDGRDAA